MEVELLIGVQAIGEALPTKSSYLIKILMVMVPLGLTTHPLSPKRLIQQEIKYRLIVKIIYIFLPTQESQLPLLMNGVAIIFALMNLRIGEVDLGLERQPMLNIMQLIKNII